MAREIRMKCTVPKDTETQTLPDFPYARYAEMLGLKGLRLDRPEAAASTWDAALASDRPVVIDAALPSPHATGKDSNMKKTLLSNLGGKTYILVFSSGNEVMVGLSGFAEREHVATSHFTAIGALSDATLGWFSWEQGYLEFMASGKIIAKIKDLTVDKVHVDYTHTARPSPPPAKSQG